MAVTALVHEEGGVVPSTLVMHPPPTLHKNSFQAGRR